MPEVTIATAVSNMAFAALWVAEQLKYFEQELRVEFRGLGACPRRRRPASRYSGA
jgi:hypothetical protein